MKFIIIYDFKFLFRFSPFYPLYECKVVRDLWIVVTFNPHSSRIGSGRAIHNLLNEYKLFSKQISINRKSFITSLQAWVLSMLTICWFSMFVEKLLGYLQPCILSGIVEG